MKHEKRHRWLVKSESGTFYGPFKTANGAAQWARRYLVTDNYDINRFSIHQLRYP